jgi:hypothetical protein
MEQYKILLRSNGEPNEYVLRISDKAFVHASLNQEYLQWIAEGNEPLPADLPPVASQELAPEPEVVPVPEQETPAP